MREMKKLILTLLILCLTGCGAYRRSNAAFYYAESLYNEARNLVEDRQYEAAINKLDGIISMKEKKNQYLTRALILRAETFIKLAQTLKNPVSFDLILLRFKSNNVKKRYNTLYALASKNLAQILSKYPADKYAPRALLIQAQIYDYNNLQAFDQALAIYKSLPRIYPESEESRIAKERVKELEKIFKSANEISKGIPFQH